MAQNSAGRPAKLKADESIFIRLDAKTKKKIERLCQRWCLNKSEAIRRAINDA